MPQANKKWDTETVSMFKSKGKSSSLKLRFSTFDTLEHRRASTVVGQRTILAGEPPAVLLLSPSCPITYAYSQRVPFGFENQLVCWFCRQAGKVSNEIWRWKKNDKNSAERVKKCIHILFWKTFIQIFNWPTSLDWPVHLLSHHKG